MQVIKVMNNSLILAVDSLGNECILMGKGIGYNQAIGNDVQLSQVEKIFLLKDKQFLLAAEFIADGVRTGRYLTGGDTLLLNSQGQSQISYADYAIAMIDEAEAAKHVQQRFTVAAE